MAEDPNAHRRRAAVAVFGELLDEPAMVDALQMQEKTMRNEGVNEIIAYVDRVAAAHGFDAAHCKKLYTAFFAALRQPLESLPEDPWLARQPRRPVKAPTEFAPVTAAVPAPQAPQSPRPSSDAAGLTGTAAPAPISNAFEVPPTTPDPFPAEEPAPAVLAEPAASVLPEEPAVVFGAIMRAVVSELHGHHREALEEVGRDASREVDRTDVSPTLKHRFRHAWRRPLKEDWQLPGLSLELAVLVRVVFVALTAAFGRNGADQILVRAVQEAEQVPEARQFSPKRLLSAM